MKAINRYIPFLMSFMVIAACSIKKNVPEGQYLLVKNQVEIPKKTEINQDKLKNVIRQRGNRKTLFIPIRLMAYNSIDSTKAEKSKNRRLKRYHRINERRLAREKRIDEKRIEKALAKGEVKYRKKEIKLKDTANPSPTLRERIKYNYGEAPVIFEKALMDKSKEQVQLFMQQNGFFRAKVSAKDSLNDEKQEAIITYSVVPNEPFFVDSIFIQTENKRVKGGFKRFMEENEKAPELPFLFQSEVLSSLRKNLTHFYKNERLYGFKENYISFEVDTLQNPQHVNVAINVEERYVERDGERVKKPFDNTKINTVTFHLLDTATYKGNFQKEQLDSRNISLKSYDQIPTFDTLRYDWFDGKHKNFRTATFLYNGEPTSKVELIEFQNSLEENNYYKGDFVTDSYNRLMSMDLFKMVKPQIEELEDNSINVHYYLTPKTHQTFSVEPKATHSNSLLGVSASINYINRNLFRQGYRLKGSLNGGFEAQPEIYGKADEFSNFSKALGVFNTFEFGPSLSLDVPGLVPVPMSRLSKRQNPLTTFSLAYNVQRRPDFRRRIFQWNYLWKFRDVSQTQNFVLGVPIIGGVQFVRIKKSDLLTQRLEQQNDLFLLNAYSNQAVYKDAALYYTFRNPDLKDGNVVFSYGFNFDMAGMIMSAITKNNPANDDGYKEFLGQRYSQFVRLDNEFTLHHYLPDNHSLHYRIQVGAGIPLENNGPTLPFDYSFFGGGSNDNRGFDARTLGPGTYKKHLDTSRTYTQMGDMRLSATFEYRFKMSSLFEGAFFTDVGNVWTYNEDPNREGGQISRDFIRELNVSAGLGLRLDLTFLIVRLDVGLPIRNASLPKASQWIFQSRDALFQEGIDEWGYNAEKGEYYYEEYFPKMFMPRFHIAIGYPF